MSKRIFRSKRWFLGVAALLLVLSVGVVTATQLSAHLGSVVASVIHSCVNNASGQINIVDANENCKGNRSPLDWNAVGPAGATGADGADGADDADGADGADGAAGAQGPAGPGLTNLNATTRDVVITSNLFSTWTKSCPGGQVLTGGGVTLVGGSAAPFFPGQPFIHENGPISSTEWRAVVEHVLGVPFSTITMRIRIFCVTP